MTDSGRRRQILIVEDDPAIVDLIRLHLDDQGYASTVVSEGDEGEIADRAAESDLVILDIMLPVADGLSICRRIREREISVPVLMLTARSAEVDKIVGLEVGADDYLTKPFSVRELVARVRALLRRAGGYGERDGPDGNDDIRVAGPIHIDMGDRRVTVDGRVVELTSKEFTLLSVLAEHPGKAFSRAELLDMVWGVPIRRLQPHRQQSYQPPAGQTGRGLDDAAVHRDGMGLRVPPPCGRG